MTSVPFLSFLHLESQGIFLLESPIHLTEILLVPQRYYDFQNVKSVNFLIDFELLVHENGWIFASGKNSAHNHQGLTVLLSIDNGRAARVLVRPEPVVLVIVSLFVGKQIPI